MQGTTMFVYHPEAAYVSAYSRKRLIGKHLRPNLTAPLLRDAGVDWVRKQPAAQQF